MSAHTPGPYHIGHRMRSDGTKEAHSIYSDSGDVICEGLTWNNNGEADAHLLAAAPELLEVLQMAMDWIPGEATIMRLRSTRTIAKATGKESQ